MLQILKEKDVFNEHMPFGIDSVSVILKSSELPSEKEVGVLRRIETELVPDNLLVERGLALIILVGEGMQYAVGNAAHATKALGDAGINIEMINMGASETSLMLAIKESDHKRAIRALGASHFENTSQRVA